MAWQGNEYMKNKIINPLINIELNYDTIFYFIDGLAHVTKSGRSGLINKSGDIVVPLEYLYCSNCFNEGLSVVSPNFAEWGFVDKSGKIVISLKYNAANTFSEGLAEVRKGDKCGFINKYGDTVIPFEYDLTTPFNDGLAYVEKHYGDNAGRYFIDKTGQVALNVDPHYYMVDSESAITSFHDGIVLACKVDEMSNTVKYGFLNKKGEVEIPFIYDKLAQYNEGYAVAFKGTVGNFCNGIKDIGSYFYIDKNSHEIIKTDCDYAEDFNEGFAAICSGIKNMPYERTKEENEAQKRWSETMMADKEDRKSWETKFLQAESEMAVFREMGHENIQKMHKNGRWGFINKSGETVIPLEYELEYKYPYQYRNFYKFSESLSRAQKGDRQGYIDKTGTIAVPFEYDYVEEFHEGLAVVQKNGKWGVLEIIAYSDENQL